MKVTTILFWQSVPPLQLAPVTQFYVESILRTSTRRPARIAVFWGYFLIRSRLLKPTPKIPSWGRCSDYSVFKLSATSNCGHNEGFRWERSEVDNVAQLRCLFLVLVVPDTVMRGKGKISLDWNHTKSRLNIPRRFKCSFASFMYDSWLYRELDITENIFMHDASMHGTSVTTTLIKCRDFHVQLP